jgi:hypothetical protein
MARATDDRQSFQYPNDDGVQREPDQALAIVQTADPQQRLAQDLFGPVAQAVRDRQKGQ